MLAYRRPFIYSRTKIRVSLAVNLVLPGQYCEVEKLLNRKPTQTTHKIKKSIYTYHARQEITSIIFNTQNSLAHTHAHRHTVKSAEVIYAST